MKVAAPSLGVRNLERSLSFYEARLGLRVLEAGKDDEGHDVLALGPPASAHSSPLVILKRRPNATEDRPNSPGLYHFAILVPDRKSLASTFLSIASLGVNFEGFADHLVSEAVYLRDPEGNGIEIYRDRPREEWKVDGDGHPLMGSLPLDVDSLLRELTGGEAKTAKPFPTGAVIGHIHLKVTDLDRSVQFYSSTIGLDIQARMSGAAFLSAGGYHHHIGLNTWESKGGVPRRSDAAGLEGFELLFPDRLSVERVAKKLPIASWRSERQLEVSDPDGISIRIAEGWDASL